VILGLPKKEEELYRSVMEKEVREARFELDNFSDSDGSSVRGA